MGNDEGGASLGQGIKCPLDLGFRDGVQSGGGFIQDEDGGIFQEDPGNGNSLLLTAGQEGSPFAHIGIKALGHCQDVLIDLCLFSRFDHFFFRCVRSAIADILKNRIGKEEYILLDDADIFMDGALGHIPDVPTVNGDPAAGHIVKPGDQLTQSGLAATGGTNNGDGLAGGYINAHIVQHIQIAVIGEGHILHPNRTLHICQRFCVGLVLHGGVHAHDVHKAAQSRKAVGKHLRETGELTHGANKAGNIQAEGQKIHIVHLIFHHKIAAHSDDRHIEGAQEEFHGAVEHAHGFIETTLGLPEQLIGVVKTLTLRFFVGKGFGGAETGEARFDFLVDMAGLLLGSPGSSAHTAAHGHDHNKKYRDHQRHHQSQLPADGTHDHQRADDGQHGCEQVLGAMVGKLRQFEQVGCQPAHQLTGTVAVVKVKAEGLHVGKQILTDVRFHRHAKHMAIVGHDIVQERTQQIAQHHRGHYDKECLVHLAGEHIVKGGSGNEGEDQIHCRNETGTQQVDGKEFFVVLKIA